MLLLELALYSQQQEKAGEFLQVSHPSHGAVDSSLDSFSVWKEPQEEQGGAGGIPAAPAWHP